MSHIVGSNHVLGMSQRMHLQSLLQPTNPGDMDCSDHELANSFVELASVNADVISSFCLFPMSH